MADPDTATPRVEGTEAVPARSDRSVIAFLAFIGILMAFGIDAALPGFNELRDAFDLDARQISPAVTGTAYLVGIAVGQLFCGVLADRFGRQKVLAGGLVLYGVGAVAAATAPTLAWLLVARFAWGAAASAPSVLRFAIARDLYHGDRMARVVSIFTAVFLIGPIFVPMVGEAILLFGSWRAVFAVGVVLAAIAVAWTVRFGETMAPEHSRPIRVGPFVEALRAVALTPATRWAIAGTTLFTASFFVWLGSAQPILDRVYGRESQFTLFFALSGTGMALALLANNRLIDRFGTARMIRTAATTHVALSSLGLIVVLAAGGVPVVWAWFGWVIAANALTMVLGPMASAVAMEPMADKAGMASALLGLCQLGLGAALAAIVDSRITDTVTPMLVGAVLFGGAGCAAMFAATRASAGRVER